MKKFMIMAVIASFVLCVITGCKPSTKGEMDKWEVSKKDLAEATAKWPAFKGVLDKKMADAQKMWDEALKLTNEDEKAKKMKEANAFLDDLLNQFTQIKYKMKGVEDAIAKFNGKKLTKSEDSIRQKAVSEAQKIIKQAENTLSTAKARAEDEAKGITQDVISKLIGVLGDIERAMKSVEPQKTAAPKKKK
jgi:hypothetical protein